MPNQPKTPVTNFRIPPGLKARARLKAKSQGKTLTDVVVEALEAYTKDAPEPPSPPRSAVPQDGSPGVG